MKECGDVFVKSLNALRKRVEESGPDAVLVWDKVTVYYFSPQCYNMKHILNTFNFLF